MNKIGQKNDLLKAADENMTSWSLRITSYKNTIDIKLVCFYVQRDFQFLIIRTKDSWF